MRTVRRAAADRGRWASWLPVGAAVAALAVGVAVGTGGETRLVASGLAASSTTATTATTSSTTPGTSVPAPTTGTTATTATTARPRPVPQAALHWTPPSMIDITRHTSTSVSLCTPEPVPPRACGEGAGTTNPSGRAGPYWFDDEFSEYALPPGVTLDPTTGIVGGYTDGFGTCIDTDSCQPEGEGGPRFIGGGDTRHDPPCTNELVCEYEWLVCVTAPDGPPREACEPVSVRVHS